MEANADNSIGRVKMDVGWGHKVVEEKGQMMGVIARMQQGEQRQGRKKTELLAAHRWNEMFFQTVYVSAFWQKHSPPTTPLFPDSVTPERIEIQGELRLLECEFLQSLI